MKIGTDIVSIQRIEKSIEKFGEKFKTKFLTPQEINHVKKIESIAGLWAAKEAIAKALGCGICADLTFHDILISKNYQGSPSFTLTSIAQERYQIIQSSLSISHDSGFAIAVVIVRTKI